MISIWYIYIAHCIKYISLRFTLRVKLIFVYIEKSTWHKLTMVLKWETFHVVTWMVTNWQCKLTKLVISQVTIWSAYNIGNSDILDVVSQTLDTLYHKQWFYNENLLMLWHIGIKLAMQINMRTSQVTIWFAYNIGNAQIMDVITHTVGTLYHKQ